jgi:hypothetical protein
MANTIIVVEKLMYLPKRGFSLQYFAMIPNFCRWHRDKSSQTLTVLKWQYKQFKMRRESSTTTATKKLHRNQIMQSLHLQI